MRLNQNREPRSEGAGVTLEMHKMVESASLTVLARQGSDVDRLVVLESIVSRGLQAYIAVGAALEEIRERKLYREQGFATFDDYCLQRWNMSARTAYQRIDAASGDTRRQRPRVDRNFHPHRYRRGAHAPMFPNQIYDAPAAIALLDMHKRERGHF
jgi:hypothetical protein